jgi:hypothetical protein
MTKDRTDSEIVKVGPTEVPAWLAPHMEQDESLAALQEYRVLGRLGLIQQMSDAELKDQHGEGSMVMYPMNVTLSALKGDGIQITPMFFWTEYVKYSDRNDKASPNIMERSFDATSEVARRAKNKEDRSEIYEGARKGSAPFMYQWVEVLNFAVTIRTGDYAGEQVGLQFQKGEFFNGKNFCTGIVQRRIPLWSQVWNLNCSLRPPNADDNAWYGFDFNFAGTIDPDEAPVALAMHEELKKLHGGAKLGVTEDDAVEVEAEDDGDM